MSLFGNRAQGRRRVPEARPSAAPKRLKGPSFSTVILVIVMITGFGIMAYPSASDWWNSYHQTRTIASYDSAVQQTDTAELERLLQEAQAYNQRLLTKVSRFTLDDEDMAEYQSVLNLSGNGLMGYVQIASLGINLPIYHGMEEQVLQVAVGHFEGTSLPVGGESTHSVITGHRGLPSARLFTDIDKMTEGDTFSVSVLGKTLTYEVDQIRIVKPSDVNDLEIVEGMDYMTLITCTPYGVNSHRLLVRGHRVDNLPSARIIPAEAIQIPNYIAVPAVGIPLLFVYLAIALVRLRLKSRKAGHGDAIAALRELEGGENNSWKT